MECCLEVGAQSVNGGNLGDVLELSAMTSRMEGLVGQRLSVSDEPDGLGPEVRGTDKR